MPEYSSPDEKETFSRSEKATVLIQFEPSLKPNEVKLVLGCLMFDKLQFVEVSVSHLSWEASDKLKFVGHHLT